MIVEHFRYDPRPKFHLKVLANRYKNHNAPEGDQGVTLVFLHCSTVHKETWEPTIDHIFNSRAVRSGIVKIRDAWSIGAPLSKLSYAFY